MKKYSLYEYMMYGLMFALYIYVDMFIINVPPTLKRSMYDYKLYVSLLIFVYSLMDSDERASLQKKCFERQTVLCACCASDGCCHFTFVICACFNICCNEHVWYVHGALHVVMSKKP